MRTYGDLVTSIVNPSHEVAGDFTVERRGEKPASPMAAAYLNDVVPPPVQPYWENYPSRRTADPGASPPP